MFKMYIVIRANAWKLFSKDNNEQVLFSFAPAQLLHER